MSVSTVDIVNTALDYIGQSTLTSLEEANPVAEKARRLWPVCLDEVLRAHFWKCAGAREKLPRLAARPAFGFESAFQLPGDFLRLIATDPENARVRVEGRALLADEKEISILYVRRLEDPTQYDSTLRQCLALKMAAMMAYGATASTAFAQGLEAQYRDRLREARAYDSMEGEGPGLPVVSSWAAAKLGG